MTLYDLLVVMESLECDGMDDFSLMSGGMLMLCEGLYLQKYLKHSNSAL